MKKIDLISLLLSTITVLSSGYVVAQSTAFRLSDYKCPKYVYQLLDLNVGLNSGLFANRIDNAATKSFSLNSEAGATYARFANSPKSQSEYHAALNAGTGTSAYEYKLESNTLKNSTGMFSHGENLVFSGLKRFYNARQNYFEVHGSLGSVNNGSSGKNKNFSHDTLVASTESKVVHFNNSVNGSFLIGLGRIEQVQDARLALYLLGDLQKLNRLKRTASDNEILAISQIITALKYKRFFDDRLRKIAEITALDSFVKQSGLAGEADAAYFTSLTDNWNYANNPVRYSGCRKFAGIEAAFSSEYDYNDHKEIVPEAVTSSSLKKQQAIGVFVVAGLVFEKPITLKWQKTANLKAVAGIRRFKYHEESDGQSLQEYPRFTVAFPSLSLEADYGFGYYPTSRTWLEFKWYLYSGWQKDKVGDSQTELSDRQNPFYAYTGPRLEAHYYLSAKLRLSFTFNGEFRFDHIKYTYNVPQGFVNHTATTWWNQQVNAGLNYSLF